MNEFSEVTDAILKFRDEREWAQFHNSKDLALAISIEASELNELFLWKNADDADVADLTKELADVLIYSFLLAEKNNLDLKKIIFEKLGINAEKYPIDKAKGNAIKAGHYKKITDEIV